MSKNYPLISVIMNCFNGERYLLEAINSVYAQTYPNWEIIFWDNASTDNSANIALSFDEKIKYFKSKETTSLGKARVKAVREAQGDYIAFLDTDDLWIRDKLEKQVELMEYSNYALCYGSAIIIDENGKETKKVPVCNTSGNVFGNLLVHYEIKIQSVMLRHSILLENQLEFSDTMKFCPDYNLFMEIASRYPVAVISDFIVKYRIHKHSLSKKTIHLVPYEVRFTLDRILNKMPGLRFKFSTEFTQAYAKVKYYKSVSFMANGDRYYAIKSLKSICFVRYEYFILLTLLLLLVPLKLILKILKR